jgi:soluble lytic murein transglycosylase
MDDSLRVLSRAAYANGGDPSPEDLRMLYPRPWRDEVIAASASAGLSEYAIFALMRSESYFRSDIHSSAGAVGLTQLMPATAQDVGRKLGVDKVDLYDPGTNILLGAAYLASLSKRLDGRLMGAFFAYNAGITHVREWDRAVGKALPQDVFLEGIPYAETREYGRKVLAAAVTYGVLYYGKTPVEVCAELLGTDWLSAR